MNLKKMKVSHIKIDIALVKAMLNQQIHYIKKKKKQYSLKEQVFS